MMEMIKGTEISSMQVENLLGHPLNDIEEKFAPKELYVRGPMQIPLPRPKVSIIDSRKASTNGLGDAQTITNALAKN
jgi:DNA processing protein